MNIVVFSWMAYRLFDGEITLLQAFMYMLQPWWLRLFDGEWDESCQAGRRLMLILFAREL